MQPFVAAENIKQSYRRYIQTSFPIRRDEVRQRFEELIDHERLLWQDPFISLSRPFAQGATFDELIAEGVFGPEIKRGNWGFNRMFYHQAEAARRLSKATGCSRNTIIASGTGSGKTEGFSIPIVDDCMRHPGAGVRAVILYPMNALANDQLKRMRQQLAGTGVTFGRYTGDTPQDEAAVQDRKGWLPRPAESPAEERYYRREIQQDPPQILITNYSMLELLLLRKQEQKIFKGVKPQFLVLDEVHTYTGILGAEVACLIRRLKEHVGVETGQITCIGTSATVKSGGAGESERRQLLEFATELFAEEFDNGAIVDERFSALDPVELAAFGRPPELRPEDLEGFDPDDAASVAALFRRFTGVDLAVSGESVFEAIYNRIGHSREFLELEHLLTVPRSLADVLTRVRTWPGREKRDEPTLRAETTAIFLLGCAARRTVAGDRDPFPRFRPKVHLQIRSLAPLNACTHCGTLLTDGKESCTSEAHGGTRAALGLGVCRSCGQDYLLGHYAGAESDVESLGEVQLGSVRPEESDANLLYLLDTNGADFVGTAEDEFRIRWTAFGVCPRCLQAKPFVQNGTPPSCENTACGGEKLRRYVAFTGGSRCPICQAQGRGRRPQIITPLRSGAAASVSVLTQSLLPQLQRSVGGRDEKKTLIFADSRQDTAHQAGYLRDRHQTFTQRQLLYQTLSEMATEGPKSVALCDDSRRSVLATEMFLRTRRKLGEAEAMNLLTPVAFRRGEDMGFYDESRVITEAERNRAIDRLRWDLAIEFTDRATTRYSLEREGLAFVGYASLAGTATELVKRSGRDVKLLEPLLAAVLDQMRYNKAVDYDPFRDYLSVGSDPVKRGIARPTRQTRTPLAFDSAKRSRKDAYTVRQWYNPDNPAAHATAIFDIVHRALGRAPAKEVADLIDQIVAILQEKGYIRRVEIGRISGRFGNLTTKAFQVSERLLEISTGVTRYRCTACGRTSAYLLIPPGSDRAICTAFRCRGEVKSFTPDSENNFYVRFYTREQPERLYAMEHSGQLSGDERVIIEEKFKEGLINALVCTPTLELGVNIGDLSALVMRNVPPTPSNYAQRAGRAGRDRRIALILAHSGQGPHDSYFFDHPEEMIVGTIRPPMFLLDNRVVVDRHLNSLILEKLETSLPGRWDNIRSDVGELRQDVIQPIEEEVAGRMGTIQQSVARAFVRERSRGGLPWLDESYVRSRIEEFPTKLRQGLDHWCNRYRSIYAELLKSRRRVVPTAAEQERERKLREALELLESDQRFQPLSYLASVGVLPRYGFPGGTVSVRDFKEREIVQAAAVGIVEFAPGNVVYVAGRKLRVDRILFKGGTREDPRQNAETYRFCPTCNYVTEGELDQQCDYCHETLSTGRYIDYEAAKGSEFDFISQEDEYRDSEGYDLAQYLKPESTPPSIGGLFREANGWSLRYSRLRTVEIYNRGRKNRGTGSTESFLVCLECGQWREKADDGTEQRSNGATGHLQSCSVSGWNPDEETRLERQLHLRASFQGDVVQIGLGAAVASDKAWRATFDQALRLGLQLELFVTPKEVGSFVREWQEDRAKHTELVLYDTMPGGTGYLRRLMQDLPRIVERVVEHLSNCSCEKACYRCLKEFWNQRSHALLDKNLVLAALRALAVSGKPAQPVESDDVRFESFLEARFYALLQEKKIPLPKTQEIIRGPKGGYIIRADFRYENPPLVILTDGRAFHGTEEQQILTDLDKRNQLEFAGRRLLEFTYRDVILEPAGIIEQMEAALGLRQVQLPPVELVAAAVAGGGTAASVFAARLVAADSRLQAAKALKIGEGTKVDALAADPQNKRVLLVVNPEEWITNPVAWNAALRAHNLLRLAGWRVLRVPKPWLDSPQGELLADQISAFC